MVKSRLKPTRLCLGGLILDLTAPCRFLSASHGLGGLRIPDIKVPFPFTHLISTLVGLFQTSALCYEAAHSSYSNTGGLLSFFTIPHTCIHTCAFIYTFTHSLCMSDCTYTVDMVLLHILIVYSFHFVLLQCCILHLLIANR